MFRQVRGKKNGPLKVSPRSLENGGFEDNTYAPWLVDKQGEFSVRLVPKEGGQALEWTLGKNVSAGSMGSVVHPAMTRLRFGETKAYRLSFSIQGRTGNAVVRHPQVAAPLVVRTIYSEEKPGTKREYRYDWLPFYPDETKRTKRILLVSPDAERWQLASVTFFLWQAGTYTLDDVTLESWE